MFLLTDYTSITISESSCDCEAKHLLAVITLTLVFCLQNSEPFYMLKRRFQLIVAWIEQERTSDALQ